VSKGKKALAREDLENFGSIITLKGTDRCLGDLMCFDDEHGCFCPANGKVPVTKEEAKAHNEALDKAMLEGLDGACRVGQGANFYFSKGAVRTFSGRAVSEDASLSGKVVAFRRAGREFRGTVRKGADFMFFERVS
jgi:hypothetical protein